MQLDRNTMFLESDIMYYTLSLQCVLGFEAENYENLSTSNSIFIIKFIILNVSLEYWYEYSSKRKNIDMNASLHVRWLHICLEVNKIKSNYIRGGSSLWSHPIFSHFFLIWIHIAMGNLFILISNINFDFYISMSLGFSVDGRFQLIVWPFLLGSQFFL
jgi:hypothetical protein